MNNPRITTVFSPDGERSIRVVECCDPHDYILRCEEAEIELNKDDADWVIDNNGTEEELTAKVAEMLMVLSYDMAHRHYKEKSNE